MNTTLKRGMNKATTTADNVADIKKVQDLLGLKDDGDFGPATETAVKSFQAKKGLQQTGVVDPVLWGIMFPQPKPAQPPKPKVPHNLPHFRGDLAWIHQWEGHAGHPYLPMRAGIVIGQSGITVDPGVDLGHVNWDLFERTFTGVLTQDQLDYLQQFVGLKGDDAKAAWVKNEAGLKAIKLTREQADKAFAVVAVPYWSDVYRLYPGLTLQTTPEQVQTVFLSLAYNRGPGNKAMRPAKDMISGQKWSDLANFVDGMQAQMGDEGLKRRRKAEADLIRSAI